MIWQKTLCDQILGRESREENKYPERLDEIVEEMLDNLPYKNKGLPSRKIMKLMACSPSSTFKEIAAMVGSNPQSVKKNYERSLEFTRRYYAKMLELGVAEFCTYVKTLRHEIRDTEKYPGVYVTLGNEVYDLFRTEGFSKLCEPTWYERLLQDVTCNDLVQIPEHLEQNVEIALGMLTPSEAEVLRLRFGADGQRRLSFEQIKNEFSIAITRERVRAIEAKAMRKLRHPARLQILQCETVWSEEILRREQAEAGAKKAAAIKMAENPSGIALEDLNLSTRTFNCLHRAEYETVGDVYNAGPDQVRQLRNFGYNSLCEVAAILREIGLVKANDAWDIYR